MTDETKILIDTLYKEFQRVNSKSVATDDWFFRFLSIAVVPFLLFTAYCLANQPYRIFVAMLPFLSLIGLAVVAVLATHYQYANSYGEYLVGRINGKLGTDAIRDIEFGRACYKGWHSPVTISYGLGFGVLVLLNVLAVPVIDSVRKGFLTEHREQLGWASLIVEYYWLITVGCVIVTVAALLISFLKVNILTRRLLEAGRRKR